MQDEIEIMTTQQICVLLAPLSAVWKEDIQKGAYTGLYTPNYFYSIGKVVDIIFSQKATYFEHTNSLAGGTYEDFHLSEGSLHIASLNTQNSK
jgi:hypothetical protein